MTAGKDPIVFVVVPAAVSGTTTSIRQVSRSLEAWPAPTAVIGAGAIRETYKTIQQWGWAKQGQLPREWKATGDGNGLRRPPWRVVNTRAESGGGRPKVVLLRYRSQDARDHREWLARAWQVGAASQEVDLPIDDCFRILEEIEGPMSPPRNGEAAELEATAGKATVNEGTAK